jgi:GntR family transcriptional regulator/MocR family aminotransferase
VASFIDEGHFAAHVRRMRKLYAERRDVLMAAAGRQLAGLLAIDRAETGLHTVGRLEVPLAEAAVAEAALARDVTVAPIGRYCIAPVAERGLVLGFSGVPPREIEKGVRVLREVLEDGEAAGTGRRDSMETCAEPGVGLRP